MKIDVLATHPLTSLTYQVLGKGDVVASELVKIPNTKSYQIQFAPTLSMVPKSRVLVFYITDDGEIISDSLEIEFEKELKNYVRRFMHILLQYQSNFFLQINVELSKGEAKPGENLEISVSTNPNSFVGLLGVDQSVLLLKKGNDIEESTVFAELGMYEYADKYNYEWHENYDYSSWRDFQSADAALITNAQSEYSKKYHSV